MLNKSIELFKTVSDYLSESTFNVLDIGIIIVDQSSNIISCNTHILKLLGYELDDLVNKSIDILIPESSKNQHKREVDQYLINPIPRTMSKSKQLNLKGRHRNGIEIELQIGLSPIKIDNKDYVIVVIVTK